MAKKKKLYEYYNYDDIYKVGITLIIGDADDVFRYIEKKDFNSKYQELTSDELSRKGGMTWEMKHGWGFCVFINPVHSDYMERGLVHELLHCAMNIFNSRAIHITMEEDEALAYYLEYLYSIFMPKLREYQD